MNNKQGGETYRQHMILLYGSEEAWKAEMRRRASLGGKAHNRGGFAYWKANDMTDKIKQAGSKGGKARHNNKNLTEK